MDIQTSDPVSIKPFLEKMYVHPPDSHKGMNGRVLIIGGSTLFHAASLWAAEVVSFFADMVHYSSTEENAEIFLNLKSSFRNGMVIKKSDIQSYVTEDDVILIGPGMVRNGVSGTDPSITEFSEVLACADEAEYTRTITYYLLHKYPDKRFVLDAGALQMMNLQWLAKLHTKAIITPHQGEFERLFGKKVSDLSISDKKEIVREYAHKYSCVVVLKAVTDIISDGTVVYTVEGGNPGLTKGGSGDILAGLTAAFYSKNDPISSAVLASFILKSAADLLFPRVGNWYNMATLLKTIPEVLQKLQTDILQH